MCGEFASNRWSEGNGNVELLSYNLTQDDFSSPRMEIEPFICLSKMSGWNLNGIEANCNEPDNYDLTVDNFKGYRIKTSEYYVVRKFHI